VAPKANAHEVVFEVDEPSVEFEIDHGPVYAPGYGPVEPCPVPRYHVRPDYDPVAYDDDDYHQGWGRGWRHEGWRHAGWHHEGFGNRSFHGESRGFHGGGEYRHDYRDAEVRGRGQYRRGGHGR
jgi:hypothetical protein